MPLTLSDINADILSKFVSMRALISVVEQLPRRIHITFGGNPKNETRLLKSLSFVTIVNSFDFAYSQTEMSNDLSWLISCKCLEPANLLVKWKASFGERFWSNSNFIKRKVLFVPYLQHNSSKPEYLPFRGMGNHQEFLQNSYLKQDNLKHQLQLSACPSRRACHFFSQILKLFFHLIAWHLILLRNYKKTRTNLIR